MTDQNRNSSNRGFASMSDEEQRRIAQKGGQASHGGQSGAQSSSDRPRNDQGEFTTSGGRGSNASHEARDDQGQFTSSGGRGSNASHEARDEQGQFTSTHSGSTSNRGFASMDDDERRRIAQKGGQASHGGQSGRGNQGGSNR